jgi:metal-responsive CopG/Arc/MetJ family transcriptional regulator
MPRTIVDIPSPLLEEVDRLCQRIGVSRAEAVRRALLVYLDRQTEVRAEGFGLWCDAGAAHGHGSPPERGRR